MDPAKSKLPLDCANCRGAGKLSPTFRGYAESIEVDNGKHLEDFWKLAGKKGFVKGGAVVAKHSEMLRWLKSEIRLGHDHANFIILYLRLRGSDPRVSAQSGKWAMATGFDQVQ